MPVGTIFQQYEPHHLGYLSIFGGALPEGSDEPKDFLQASLTPSAMMGSYWTAEPAKLADGSFTDEDGLYIVTPSDYGRWAIYEYDIRFLVWEQADRERLAGWLLNPALAADQMNDDPHAIIEVPPVQTT
jgi:hypothetical protein